MATVEEEEEGRQLEKHPKIEWSSPTSSSHDPVSKRTREGDGDGAGEKTKSKLSPNGGGRNEKGSRSEVIMNITIDADVLDCPICFEQLSPPIFQCSNGHIACSPCSSIVENCPSCTNVIGLRCLAVEKIIESISLPCPYASSGCEQLISYAAIDVHKMMCEYSPCYCPAARCNFQGPTRELCQHFIEAHRGCSTPFQYSRACSAVMDKVERFQVRHGEEDGVLFLLLHTEIAFGVLGNAVMVACLGPDSMEGRYRYKLKATDTQKRGSSVQLESPVSNLRRWEGSLPQKNFLMIPETFRGWYLDLEITIWNNREECQRTLQK